MSKASRSVSRTSAIRGHASRPRGGIARSRPLERTSLAAIIAEIERCEAKLKDLQRVRNDCRQMVGRWAGE